LGFSTRADAPVRRLRLFTIRCPRDRYEADDRLAVARYCHCVAPLDEVEKLAKSVPRLERSNFAHH